MPSSLPCGRFVEVGRVVALVELDVDAQVVLQLRLDLGRDDGRIRQVAADGRPEVELVGLAEVEAGGGEFLLGRRGVEVVPLGSDAAVGDLARREVVGDRRAARVEGVDDALAVDALGDRLADRFVLPWRERVVEAEVEHVQPGAGLELQVRVALDGREVGRADVVDAVDGAGLELDEPLGRLLVPAEDGLRGHGLVGAPVAVVRVIGDVLAAVPRVQLVRTGAVDGRDDLLGRRGRVDVRLEPARVVDRERGERDLRTGMRRPGCTGRRPRCWRPGR